MPKHSAEAGSTTITGAPLRLSDASGVLGRLIRAQQARAIGEDVRIAEVMALLISTCQGALQGAWDEDLQRRALAVIFNGLAR